MEQIAFIDMELNKETKRKVERLLSSYRNMDAIIKSMEEDIPEIKLVSSYTGNESQRSNEFYSEPEKIVLARERVGEKRITKAKLDRLYHSIKPEQKRIWEEAYVQGRYHDALRKDMFLSRRQYDRHKRELFLVIAEAFYLL
ncbi:hypothetical protein [Aneurinibacillus migulanus]|uniref:hypothetical protein n=1 Tax=Aneurinibacillus migulanus TaxID=47500 RepID=UPI0020A0CF3F|nr:hypothetical protein [Aneurinibacillus migulanus]MCP1355072.1 hypothetical protein [Aneurinibacillus migulanus]